MRTTITEKLRQTREKKTITCQETLGHEFSKLQNEFCKLQNGLQPYKVVPSGYGLLVCLVSYSTSRKRKEMIHF